MPFRNWLRNRTDLEMRNFGFRKKCRNPLVHVVTGDARLSSSHNLNGALGDLAIVSRMLATINRKPTDPPGYQLPGSPGESVSVFRRPSRPSGF
ncbi:predicted protein [Chaetomium globosum CBS 148.51]|uniref:Uncharacterized protein n=1 Tax=Chaetomium globosum (strain ATCC 6205 / CBS 148.51 / DSM 1962 / NBRC 6347 / NRRL 1970) TaxID=306901 RepID=Q2GYL1_CHAGB|nr:uncharacterized protein CHGG_06943 [Chaetomium globosum CBS 148.51]EAQ85690.1 predicted protein [Chaetomium globosum CBS 148.51]